MEKVLDPPGYDTNNFKISNFDIRREKVQTNHRHNPALSQMAMSEKVGFIVNKSGWFKLKTFLSICLACYFFSSVAFAFTINNTVWKVNEYPFDYYGFHKYQFYLRYDGDDWWKWNKGFPFSLRSFSFL